MEVPVQYTRGHAKLKVAAVSPLVGSQIPFKGRPSAMVWRPAVTRHKAVSCAAAVVDEAIAPQHDINDYC